MNFNKHLNVEGKHAFLSASKYHWVKYDEDKFDAVYRSFYATQRGTELHALAAQCIKLGVELPRVNKTLNMHVNDAIEYRMSPEVVLYYSPNCFGTADAIIYDEPSRLLRIHDLKTGSTPASMTQLDIYTALFCLEYNKNPAKMDIENRIYQSDEVIVRNPPADDIFYVMDKIVAFDRRIEILKLEE